MHFITLFLALVASVAGSPMPQGAPVPPGSPGPSSNPMPSIVPMPQGTPTALSPTVLPIPIPSDVAAGNGLNSIIASLRKASIKLNGNANTIAAINANFAGNVSVKPMLSSMYLNTELGFATTTLWSTAMQVEMAVCAMASSMSSQNVDAQKANLVAGIQAETAALVNLQTTLATTVATIQKLAAAFTAQEKLLFTIALEELLDSAKASVVPLATLVKGLEAAGVSGTWAALTGLKASVHALATTFATASASLTP